MNTYAITAVLPQFYLYINVMHVTSFTRLSRFSVCNIEKLGIGPGHKATGKSYGNKHSLMHIHTPFVDDCKTELVSDVMNHRR